MQRYYQIKIISENREENLPSIVWQLQKYKRQCHADKANRTDDHRSFFLDKA